MKTAVSIPDELYDDAERYARAKKKSRSQLYAEALAEYLSRRQPAKVTAALDEALTGIEAAEETDFARAAAARTLQNVEW